ncbi:hypothetical protein Tco_0391116 [Tanacetum coccineum]
MEESLPTMVDDRVNELTKTQVPVYVAQGLIMERQQRQADVAKMIADAIQQERENLRAEIYFQINNAISNHIPSQVDSSVRNYMSGHILHVHPTRATPASAQEQQYQLYLTMREKPQLQQDDLPIWLALKYKFDRLHVSNTPCRPYVVFLRDHDDPHDDAHPKGQNSTKRQITSEHETFVFGESSSGQDYKSEPGPSTSELVNEMSQTVDEAKLRKVVDEMLRQRCTSGYEHQYHIDQMQNFLKNDIVWESRKEILVSPHPQRPTPVVQSYQRDPKAPALSLVNQDLLYLKKGSSGPEKIVMSLHKFPAVNFPDDDIEERTSRWVDKCVKKFYPYARYNVEHWKNPHAKIFYIKKQKEPEKPKEVVYSNSKIVQINKTYRELRHEHKFITEIVAIRANGNIVSITESDYKNLSKNDIEDMYTLIVNSKVDDYAETARCGKLSKKVNLTASTITFPSIEKYTVFSIVSEPVYGLIYKNSKKEKRVMRHQEVHKFCDATLKRVLEGFKSYNNDVKHGYVTLSLSNEDAEYLQLFEEEIEERLMHHDQMRR